MKKINVLIIAIILIAVHLLAFFLFIGGNERDGQSLLNRKTPTLPVQKDEPEMIDIPDIEIPELNLFPSTPSPVATTRTELPTPAPAIRATTSGERIATAGSAEGCLRKDLPDRRTETIFQKLIGDPYEGAIVVDARTGKILFENKATSYAYPASITKLMTLLLVLEQIDAGRIHLDDKVAITKEVSEIGGSEVFLDARESGFYTVDNLLQALMIHSANDAARALALHVAGSRDAFVAMMNRRARELGMNSTTYHSEHGLPPSDGTQPDISTPYDIAILCLAVMRHPKTLELSSTKLAWLPKSPIRSEDFMLANRNVLVRQEPYPGCDGLKTGYHAKGGYSLAATAKQGDDRIIAVIVGVADTATRTAQVKKLLDNGFAALKQP